MCTSRQHLLDPMVVGSNYLVFGSASDGAFPQDAQPAAFIKAFGGEEATAADHYGKICGKTADEIAAAATQDGTSMTDGMEADLRAASIAMETYFTEKGTYPTALSDLNGFTPKNGNELSIARADATSYCLDVANPGAADVKAHFDSETDTVAEGVCPKG
jgi:hypothetical protein